jgi:hypothetical protein
MERKELFDEMGYLSRMVQMLGTIVQNEGPPPPKEDLLRWAQDMNEITDRIQTAKKNIIKHYLEK